MRNVTKFTTIITVLTSLCLIFTGCAQQRLTRYGSVIGLRPDKLEEYKEMHAAVWPGVLKQIKECNIHNYSIYLGELEKDQYYLFAYFEYTGDDFEADMAKMAEDETTQRWWKHTDPQQIPIPTRKEGQWWASMEEVFHTD